MEAKEILLKELEIDAEKIRSGNYGKVALNLKQIEKIIQSLQSNEWVSVEERLPSEPCCTVLVFGESINSVALFQGGVFYPDFNAIGNSTVTHWMPLPTPPKKIRL